MRSGTRPDTRRSMGPAMGPRACLLQWLPRFGLTLGVLLAAGVAPPASVAAQQVISGPGTSLAEAEFAEVAATRAITPRGAMIRSMILPGWGHVATESFGRGTFYVAAQGGSFLMLWQSLQRKRQAESFERRERGLSAERLLSAGMDPDSVAVAVDQDRAVQGWAGLASSRGEQVEDWAALSIFLMLLGAVDAYVAAHLMDYPDPLAFQVVPRGTGQGVDLGFRVPVGPRPPAVRPPTSVR